MKFSRNISFLLVSLIFWSCGGSSSPQSRPSIIQPISGQMTNEKESDQSRLEFFPTANRARENIASLLNLTEARVDATLSALSDDLISENENTFTPLPRNITPVGIQLDPDTGVDLSNDNNNNESR